MSCEATVSMRNVHSRRLPLRQFYGQWSHVVGPWLPQSTAQWRHVSLGLAFIISCSISGRCGGGSVVTGFSCPVTLSLAIWLPFVLFHFMRRFWNHTFTCQTQCNTTDVFNLTKPAWYTNMARYVLFLIGQRLGITLYNIAIAHDIALNVMQH